MSKDGYTISKWADLDNYECDFCPFATVEGKEVMITHLASHAAEAPAAEAESEPAPEAMIAPPDRPQKGK